MGGIWVFIGAVLGLTLWNIEVGGFFFGGVAAWLLWDIKRLKSQVHDLKQQQATGNQVLSGSKPLEPRIPKLQTEVSANHKKEKPAHIGNTSPLQRPSVQTSPQQRKPFANDNTPPQIAKSDAWLTDLFEKLTPILTWFISGNTLVRIGSIVLFFGAGFLLKYAAEHSQLSIEIRMMGVAAAAFTMLGVGWYIRVRRMVYGLALQGGGLGLLYLTIFASFRLYALLPASIALILLAIVSGVGVALAVVYNARWLAILSFAGGFLAPILASTGTGSHIALFSWYAVLNIGIAVLAWFKAWRSLNLLGMIATFIIVALWGSQYYQEAYFNSVEPFLIGFGLMYLAIGVLFSLHRADPEQEGFGKVDASIIFGTPVGFFLLQTPLVHHFEHGMSLSALLSGLLYMSVAWLAYKYENKTLMLALLSIGGALLTLAIPLEFDSAETAAAWAMEGVGLLWLGLKQKSSRSLATGIALQAMAVGSWLWESQLFITPSFAETLSAFVIALAAWASAFIIGKHQSWGNEHIQIKATLPFDVAFAFQIWGTIAWVVAGATELHRYFNGYEMLLSGMAWIFVSAWLINFLGARLAWRKLKSLNQGLIFVCWFGLLVQIDYAAHPGQGWGWLLWLFTLLTTLWMLYISDKEHLAAKNYHLNIFHIAASCFILVLISWEIHWQASEWLVGIELWQGLVIGLVASLLLMFASANATRWPVHEHKQSYLKISASIYIIVLLFWMLWQTKEPVETTLPFIPVLNPLDIVMIIMAMAVFRWFKALQELGMVWFDKNIFYAVSGIAVFVWFNADIARVVHHYFDVPWTESAILHAVEFQAALSISWSILALVLMLMAGRHQTRYLWMVGAVLLSMVMLKLFTIDMSGSGTLARIISFLGAGGLFLIIGYFAPLPPAHKAQDLP